MTLRGLRGIPSPLELADGALDTVAEVIKLPGRVAANVAGAAQRAAEGFNAGVSMPEQHSGIPAPPDVVAGGAVKSVSSVVNGVVDGVGGAVDAVGETVRGVQTQVEGTFR